MAKKGNGEGTIFKGTSGTWRGKLTIGYDENGKQKRKEFYGKTKREVQEKMDIAKVELAKGTYIEHSKMTVGEWMDIWLEEYKKRSIKHNSYMILYKASNLHIKPLLGKYKLKDLRPEMVQKFINDLSDKGLAPKTVSLIFGALYGALNQAAENDLIAKNVSAKVKLPKAEKKEMRVMSPEEQERFIQAAKRELHGDVFILMLATGLRLGEALSLQWDDINFENGTLAVNKTLLYIYDYEADGIKSKTKVGTPKTKSSNRVVPLLPNILKMLREKEQKAISNEYNLVFPNFEGKYLARPTVYTHFLNIIKNANVQDVHPHTLRHTFATRGLESGIELIIMSKLLGHSSIKMTADIYTHVLPDVKKDSIMKLQNAFSL